MIGRLFQTLVRTSAALLLLSASLSAQSLADYDYENLAFRGFGFDYGFIWPTKVQATSSYSLRIDLGYLGPGIRIAPVLSYWSSDIRSSELRRFADQLNRLPALRDRAVVITPEELGIITWSDLSLGLDAHLVWTTPFRVLTYIGAGVGLHALNGQGPSIQSTFVEDLLDSTAGGFALMAGAEIQPVARLRLYGEARLTIMSDIRYPGIRVGGALMLPPRAAQPAQGG